MTTSIWLMVESYHTKGHIDINVEKNRDKVVMRYSIGESAYIANDGRRLGRERDSLTHSGAPMANRWVLRDRDGHLIDYDQYRNDLAERHGLNLVGSECGKEGV